MSIERAELSIFQAVSPADNAPAGVAPSRSLIRQAYHDTLAKTSARVGLAWLLLMAFFAVLAPFLANSHPYAMKMDGRWSSPVLRYLTPTDVLVVIGAAAVITLAVWRQFSFPQSVGLTFVVLMVAVLPVYRFIQPPVNVDYSEYRMGLASGRVEHAFFPPVPYSPRDRLRDQPEARLQAPSRTHWLGTDTDGADVFSVLLYGSRIALSIGFIATSIAVVIGVLVGGVMGYSVGVIDLLGMRAIEIFEAIPQLLLLIIVTAVIRDRNIYIMMVVIGLTSWPSYARFVRAEFFTIRKLDYVQAAVAAGIPRPTILFRHMLANALTPVLVSTTFGVASAILYESTLSFLGIGLVDEASWGLMLNQARAGGAGFVLWLAIPPGAAIFLTVFAYNLVGESIRDALDPKLRKRE